MPLTRRVLAATILSVLALACSQDQPTEPGREPVTRPSFAVTCTDPCLVDNFTDTDGTLLQNHTPDGGSMPFSWLPAESWGFPEAVIQDNAVIARLGLDWAHVTSVPTGDWAELTVDVLGDAAETGVAQDIVMWMRTADADLHDGFEVYWSIGPTVNAVTVHGRNIATGIYHFPSPTITPGLHTFRAEINPRGAMEVSIDGELVLTHPLGALPPPNRTGLGFWTNGTPTVRLTSFVAAVPTPRERFSLKCVPNPVTRGAVVTCTARLNATEDWTPGIMESRSPDGHLAFADLHVTPDGRGLSSTGEAVFSSEVKMTGFVPRPDGSFESLLATTSLTVRPRVGFPSPLLPPGGPEAVQERLHDPGRPPLRLGGYTRPAFSIGPKGTGTLQFDAAASGPHRGFGYLIAAPPLRQPFVFLHDALSGKGAWYQDQDGVDRGQTTAPSGLPYCTGSQITSDLLFDVIRHEGGPTKSHHTIWRDVVLPLPETSAVLEGFVFPTDQGSNETEKDLNAVWERYGEQAYRQYHLPFDKADLGENFVLVQERIECAFDNNPGD